MAGRHLTTGEMEPGVGYKVLRPKELARLEAIAAAAREVAVAAQHRYYITEIQGKLDALQDALESK